MNKTKKTKEVINILKGNVVSEINEVRKRIKCQNGSKPNVVHVGDRTIVELGIPKHKMRSTKKNIPIINIDGEWELISKENFMTDFNGKRIVPTVDIFFTPQKAKDILETTNWNNRKVDWTKVNAYKQMLKDGLWYNIHQGIAFYENGTLSDGQHRLLAIEISGVGATLKVTSGLEIHSSYGIDYGKKRSICDTAKINGETDFNRKELKTASWMTSGVKNKKGSTLANEKLIIYCKEHKDALRVSEKVNSLATIRSAYARLFYNYHQYNKYNDGDAFPRFCELAKTLEKGICKNEEEDSGGFYLFHKTLTKEGRKHFNGNEQESGYYKAEKCMIAFMKREYIKVVKLSKSDRLEKFPTPAELEELKRDIE